MNDRKKAFAKAMAELNLDAAFPSTANPTPTPAPAPPIDARGAQRSRLNAYKHGLTGQIRILTPEEQTLFDAHCKGICESLAPVGALEIDLAQAIAEGRWRLKRALAIETSIYATDQMGLYGPQVIPVAEDPAQLLWEDTFIKARTWLTQKDNFLLLALYEQRINRTIERNMATIHRLQAERKAAFDKAMEEALLLAQFAESKGEKYDVAADFPRELLGTNSVFSVAAISLLITRNLRLNKARDYAKTGRIPEAA
jgi:hypothetical protein